MSEDESFGIACALSADEEEREEGDDELTRHVDAHVVADQLEDENAVGAQVIVHEVVVLMPRVAEFGEGGSEAKDDRVIDGCTDHRGGQ